MAARKTRPSLADQTPTAEWIAAALGLILTLGVVGYTVWEGLTEDRGPPRLAARAERPIATTSGYVLPIVVDNQSHATAAEVVVRGVLRTAGREPEERRASFAYVPGEGEARGGLVFRQDPTAGQVELIVEGFADP